MKIFPPLFRFALAALLFFPAPSLMAAQGKLTDETVKTKQAVLPPVPIDDLDVSTVKAYLVFKDMKQLSKELATTTSDGVCNAINKKIGQKGPYTNHYYKITFSDPDPLLALKTGDGKVIYATAVNPGISPEDRFGTGCMSSKASLDKALADAKMTYNPGSFEAQMKKETSKEVQKGLKTLLVPEYDTTKFKLFSAQGAGYQDLEEALSLSLGAYANMLKIPMTAKDKEDLTKAMGIWEKALKEADLNDKNARIDNKLAVRLNHNIAMNALAVNDFPSAVAHLQNIKRIQAGFSSSGGAIDPDRFIDLAMVREKKAKLSPKTAQEMGGFLARAEQIKLASKNIPLSILTNASYDSVLENVQEKKAAGAAADQAQAQAVQKAGASSNPFEDKVQKTAMQGYTLFLMPFITPKYDAFPKEICELTHLNQIQLASNTLQSVPKEIGKLVNLKVLNLSSNQITSIPPEIGKLVNLEKLDLAKNQLTTLPAEIGNLKNLKSLNLAKNNISPSELGKIQGLLPNCKIKG